MWSAGQLNRLVRLCVRVVIPIWSCVYAMYFKAWKLTKGFVMHCVQKHISTHLQKLQKHDGRLAWPNMGTITVTQRSIFPIKICKKVL